MRHTILAFDTNIWIYLTKPAFSKFLFDIKDKIGKDEIEIVVNDIIIAEWNRNKSTTIKSLSDSIKNELLSAQNIANYIQSPEDRAHFTKTLESYKSEQDRLSEAEKIVDDVELLMTQNCLQTVVSDEQKLTIANMAINKIPPFQNNKNNFNDALIIRNLAEYANDRVIHESNAVPLKYDFIYVSNNPKDYIDPNTNEIYPDILHGIENIRILTVRELGKAFFESTELIDEFDEWLEDALENQMWYEFDIARGK